VNADGLLYSVCPNNIVQDCHGLEVRDAPRSIALHLRHAAFDLHVDFLGCTWLSFPADAAAAHCRPGDLQKNNGGGGRAEQHISLGEDSLLHVGVITPLSTWCSQTL